MEPGWRRTIGSPRVHSQGAPTTGRVSRRSRAAGHARGRHHLYEPVWTETSRRSEHWPRRRKGLPPPLEPTGAHRNPAAETQAKARTPPAALARPPYRPPRTLSFPAAPLTGIQPQNLQKTPRTTDAPNGDRDPSDRPAPGLCATRADPRDPDGLEPSRGTARARARGHSHSGLSRSGEGQREGPSRLQRVARARGKSPAELHFPGGPGTRSVRRRWRKQKNNFNAFMENGD